MTLSAHSRTQLLQWASVDGVTLVVDAVPASDGEAGRAAELTDLAVLKTIKTDDGLAT